MARKLLLNEHVILTLIIINALVVFLLGFPQVPHAVQERLLLLDHAITLCFVLEMAFKLQRDSTRGFFKDPWNRFDFVVIALSLPSLAEWFTDAHLGAYGFIVVLRTVRVAKLVRSVRFLPNIDKLIKGMHRAVRASFLVFVVFAIALFIVALLSQRLFGALAPAYFGDPLRALYSVFKVFTVEGWFEVPDQVAAQLPPVLAYLARGYFATILLAGGIIGLSLVNSIIVDAMVEDNTDELEAKVDVLTGEVRALRRELDERHRAAQGGGA